MTSHMPRTISLGRRLHAPLGVLKEGWEGSANAMHATAAAAAFASDFLKPLLPHCTVWLLIVAVVLAASLLVWLANSPARTEKSSAIVVYLLVVAILSSGLFALQRFEGDPLEGGIAHLSDSIKKLQKSLDIMPARMEALGSKLDATDRALDRDRQSNRALSGDLKAMEARLTADIARQKGVPLDALTQILQRFGADSIAAGPDRIEELLNQKADEYLALRDQLAQLSAEDPRARALQKEAEAAFERSDFDGARKKLHAAAAIDRAALAELATRAQARALAAEKSLERSADVANVALQYREAASDFSEASELIAPYDRHLAWVMAFRKSQALERQGEELGDEPALKEAAAAYRASLAMAQTPKDAAKSLNNLGNTLQSIGEHERGTARLEEAEAAFREAIKQSPRESDPVLWAGRENNIASALVDIGKHKNDSALIEQGAAGFREILKIYTQKSQPDDWAMAQYNLAITLATVSERRNRPDVLAPAIAAAREAEKGYTRESDPLDWAMVKTALGMALDDLGRSKQDPAPLVEAVASFHEALKERRRERAPLGWAETQINLGTALRDLAGLKNDPAMLADAAAAERAALTVYSRDRTPPLWAAAQDQLCAALGDLGARKNDPALLGQARSACRAAVDEFSLEGDQFNLTQARKDLARAESGVATGHPRKI